MQVSHSQAIQNLRKNTHGIGPVLCNSGLQHCKRYKQNGKCLEKSNGCSADITSRQPTNDVEQDSVSGIHCKFKLSSLYAYTLSERARPTDEMTYSRY